MYTRSLPHPRFLVAAMALLGLLGGCADGGKSGDSRLDRLEARLDRLDDRLARTEARLATAASSPERTADANTATSDRRDRLRAALDDMDPERRARLRKQFSGLRRRMERLEEGADINAKPGTPEFRRALVLQMMRQQGPGGSYRGRDDVGDEASSDAEPAAQDEDGGDTPDE